MGRPILYFGCKVDGCENKHASKGYCWKHYFRFLKYGSPHILKILRGVYKKCTINRCSKKHFSKGLCRAHYEKKYYHNLSLEKKKERLIYWKEFYKTYPWKKTLENIRKRCNNNKESYYKKGRKCLITSAELKYLWFRDKAYLMKLPSIDRKNNDGDYTLKNCQYLEMSDNIEKIDYSFARGENNYNHKLTWKQVREIRKQYIPRVITRAFLAKKYKVSSSTIFYIIKNINWKEI